MKEQENEWVAGVRGVCVCVGGGVYTSSAEIKRHSEGRVLTLRDEILNEKKEGQGKTLR